MTRLWFVKILLVIPLLIVASARGSAALADSSCARRIIGGSAISFTQSDGGKVSLLLDVKGVSLTGSADYGLAAGRLRGTVHGQLISGRLEFQVRWNDGRVTRYYLFIDDDGFVLGWGQDALRPANIAIVRGTRRLDCAPEQVTSEAVGGGMENDTNRAFSDYFRFEIPGRTPEVCQSACLANSQKCRAWAYVRPGFQGPRAICYMKHAVPAALPDKCCISGVLPRKSPETQQQDVGAIPPFAPERQEVTEPASAPRGAIGEKYAKLGGSNGALGQPVGNEAIAPHEGRCQAFQHGVICWHPQIGEAFGVWGSIGEKWGQIGGAEFGYPITDEQATSDSRGRYNHFRGMQYPNRPESSIFWSPQSGAHAIYGAIRDAWAQQGWERGPLGYPTSDEHQDGKYRRQNFERGHIVWAPDVGIQVRQ